MSLGKGLTVAKVEYMFNAVVVQVGLSSRPAKQNSVYVKLPVLCHFHFLSIKLRDKNVPIIDLSVGISLSRFSFLYS